MVGRDSVEPISKLRRSARFSSDSTRDRLERRLIKDVPGTCRNGAADTRLPNTCNICFHGIEAEAILMLLDQVGICASSGSACKTGSIEPSHVLTAMGLRPSLARGAVRFSLGVYNTEDEVDFLLEQLPPIIDKLRAVTPPEPAGDKLAESTPKTDGETVPA